jgi:hypothetical protein
MELYVDGKFMVSWDKRAVDKNKDGVMVPAYMVDKMCELAFAKGLDARSAEILKLLGGRS